MASIFNEKLPTIPDFFKNKNIFLTGGSGFIGKVLIEKLLRSCPDIGNIYVLLREKKTKTPQERVKDMTDIPLFEPLKKLNVNAIKKIVPLNGDICQLRLGLNDDDRHTIINKVNVIIHIAASVRFDDPLKKAIINNLRSTVEVIQLAKDLKNLAVLVHVSTAYCNCDKEIIEEKLYPAHVSWRDAIFLAEKEEEHVLEIFSQKYIEPLPNTYTFTKALAEHAVNDLCGKTIPAVILRPSIVVSTMKEPILSWVDNFNGPFGLAAATTMGFLRTSYADKEKCVDHVFVDNFIKSLIIAAWEKALSRDQNYGISIYNCCTEFSFPLSVYSTIALKIYKEVKMDKLIWPPVSSKYQTKCYYYYFMIVILLHMIPAILLDGLRRLVGKKPFVVMLQRRMYIANVSLFYFMSQSWEFKRQNYLGLEDKLLQNDLAAFSFRISKDLNTDEERHINIKNIIMGIKKYLLNESRTNSRKAIVLDRNLRLLEKILQVSASGFILYTMFWKYDFYAYLSKTVCNYFSKLLLNTTDYTFLNL